MLSTWCKTNELLISFTSSWKYSSCFFFLVRISLFSLLFELRRLRLNWHFHHTTFDWLNTKIIFPLLWIRVCLRQPQKHQNYAHIFCAPFGTHQPPRIILSNEQLVCKRLLINFWLFEFSSICSIISSSSFQVCLFICSFRMKCSSTRIINMGTITSSALFFPCSDILEIHCVKCKTDSIHFTANSFPLVNENCVNITNLCWNQISCLRITWGMCRLWGQVEVITKVSTVTAIKRAMMENVMKNGKS